MNAILESINIETTVLVAVWDQPAIFQGAFKIAAQDNRKSVLLFFRCEYLKPLEQDTVEDLFGFDDYQFSHLYNETQLIQLDKSKEEMRYAEYVLKYALHQTLLEMRVSQKQKFTAIDNVAMQALIKRVEPMLKQEGVWELSDNDLGFAAAMDFCPQEIMGQLAVKMLLNLDCIEDANLGVH